MLFSSLFFLFLFLPIVVIIYFFPCFKNRGFRNNWLLLASFFFYAWGEPFFVLLMCLSIVINWWLAIVMEKRGGRWRKNILFLTIVYNVGILIVFKYLGFILENLRCFVEVPIVEIGLPIGISFFSFQIMSYIFDVYYGKAECQRDICKLALYISMFPQLVAGPIIRYQTVIYEIENRKENFEDFSKGVRRFVVGLAKKILLADCLGRVADEIFAVAEISYNSVIGAWIGAIAYTLQIFYDFSAYSDMAIGLGLCFGFHFKENFNYPYIAKSVTEFWHRWHISLTEWFRDYIYIPLGGNRVSQLRHVGNLLIVWVLTGIWHGANWTFVLWGFIYFLFQVMEKYFKTERKIPAVIKHFYTLAVVVFCWVIFRSNSLLSASRYLKTLVGINTILIDDLAIYYFKNSIFLIILGIFCCIPWKEIKQKKEENYGWFYPLKTLFVIFILIFSIMCIISGAYSPFIYFNF